MKTIWTQHLKDEEDKTRYEKSLKNSKWILEDLNKILSKLGTEFHKASISPKQYDLRNWDYRQAHSNGYLQCLSQIQDLINLDQKETLHDPGTTQ